MQTNPGPVPGKSIYPCGNCALAIDWGDKAVCCDDCDVWFHKSCLDMKSAVYKNLAEDSSKDWYCFRCKTPNSSHYHSYEYSVSTRNSFSILSSPREENVFGSPHAIPMAQSSPIGTQPVPRPANVHPQSLSTEVSSSSRLTSASSQADLRKKGMNWRTLVININGIRGKVAELEHVIDCTNPDAVLIYETKLDKSVNTQEVVPSDLGYTTYSKDQDSDRGRRIMLLIKNSYISQILNHSGQSESLWVEVQLKDSRNYISRCSTDNPTTQLINY